MEREVRMNLRHLVFAAFLLTLASAIALASSQNSTQAAAPAQRTDAQKQKAEPPNEGERVFKQNCSRCHTEPDGFSSRISGTIVRHMRVRASLSQQDEKELLHFLNP
jgi:hypothetical protein